MRRGTRAGAWLWAHHPAAYWIARAIALRWLACMAAVAALVLLIG